ncbi:MAG: acyl-CoA reductase, partial [Candidatus Thorarchaeota archaeon]
LSTSIVGKEAFNSRDAIYTAAALAARDVGVFNQEACVCARVIYVESGTDAEGIEKANQFGQYLYSALMNLPPEFSTAPKVFNAELKNEIDAIRLTDDFYQVYGGQNNEGAVIVSQWDEPVDFSAQLCSRVANIVPVDSIETAVQSTNAYTQTAGIYPETLKTHIRDRLVMHGVQRIVSLGHAGNGSFATPQDAIEPLRRQVKWVMDEQTI